MSQSLCRIIVHIIFSTKSRTACLTPQVRAELYPYTAEVLKTLDCLCLEVGGTSDHIHVLCLLSKNITAADLIEEIKKPTSKWIKTKGRQFSKFHWQNGYGVFSVSESGLEACRKYITHQEEHHQSRSFQDEFRRFLIKYNVPYDERYVWD